MSIQFTSREFNQDRAAAARAAKDQPVIVTNRGEPALVLLSFKEYERLVGRRRRITDLLSFPEVADIEFELPPRNVDPRPFESDDE